MLSFPNRTKHEVARTLTKRQCQEFQKARQRIKTPEEEQNYVEAFIVSEFLDAVVGLLSPEKAYNRKLNINSQSRPSTANLTTNRNRESREKQSNGEQKSTGDPTKTNNQFSHSLKSSVGQNTNGRKSLGWKSSEKHKSEEEHITLINDPHRQGLLAEYRKLAEEAESSLKRKKFAKGPNAFVKWHEGHHLVTIRLSSSSHSQIYLGKGKPKPKKSLTIKRPTKLLRDSDDKGNTDSSTRKSSESGTSNQISSPIKLADTNIRKPSLRKNDSNHEAVPSDDIHVEPEIIEILKKKSSDSEPNALKPKRKSSQGRLSNKKLHGTNRRKSSLWKKDPNQATLELSEDIGINNDSVKKESPESESNALELKQKSLQGRLSNKKVNRSNTSNSSRLRKDQDEDAPSNVIETVPEVITDLFISIARRKEQNSGLTNGSGNDDGNKIRSSGKRSAKKVAAKIKDKK